MTALEFDANRGLAGRRWLNGLASEYGRQVPGGQLPAPNAEKSE
jgi:hypothetical protein